MDAVQEAVERAESAIREAAATHLPHASLRLFGSRALGTAGRRSDFDLAIIPRHGYSPSERHAFAEALDESLQILYPVDLVEWKEASPELRGKIVNDGIEWKS